MVSRFVPDAGDIIWVDFDPTKGSEQAGHRPAVVLSPFAYNNKTGLCVCVPCTTKPKGYPFEVAIASERESVALADQVKSIAWKARGASKKGAVSGTELQQVRAKIRIIIGL
ncbi:endoribonuclease MazF [Kosakonia sp. S42]|uniref:endoribonuclease MazF n=1 Tax=Kosakonia sp. S42 TaxID=2767458 RepID=UPI001909344F|nr:endoribonuclease MazF [Kosakonia sp. S42]MBK0019495.1 endoribonuclease MazF [Kosakonia sp. S42]